MLWREARVSSESGVSLLSPAVWKLPPETLDAPLNTSLPSVSLSGKMSPKDTTTSIGWRSFGSTLYVSQSVRMSGSRMRFWWDHCITSQRGRWRFRPCSFYPADILHYYPTKHGLTFSVRVISCNSSSNEYGGKTSTEWMDLDNIFVAFTYQTWWDCWCEESETLCHLRIRVCQT